MKWLNYKTLAAIGLIAMVACQPKELELTGYDIVLETSTIKAFEPATALVGTNVTISGDRMDDANLKVYLGTQLCKIVSQNANNVVVTLPRVINADYFTTVNSIDAKSMSATKFEPIYPETVITESSINDSLFKAAPYVITGQNLDLITRVIFKDTVINIDGTQVKDPTKLSIIVKEANPLKPKFKAEETIKFVCKAGNELPTKSGIVVMENYPVANLVFVDPKTASKGETVTFVFDEFKYAQLITEIKIGKKVAAFTLNNPYVSVTIPADAADGAIEIKNSYGAVVKYAKDVKLTVN
jgi:hypothetical protein